MEQSKQLAWEKAQQVAGTLSKQVQEKLTIATSEEAAHAKEVSMYFPFFALCTPLHTTLKGHSDYTLSCLPSLHPST